MTSTKPLVNRADHMCHFSRHCYKNALDSACALYQSSKVPRFQKTMVAGLLTRVPVGPGRPGGPTAPLIP